jgi:hypothetical protein
MSEQIATLTGASTLAVGSQIVISIATATALSGWRTLQGGRDG